MAVDELETFMRSLTALPLALALIACDPAETISGESVDIQIDGETRDDPNGRTPRDAKMCLTEDGQIYALWLTDDEEEDLYNIKMNYSGDFGATWFETPVRVNQGDPDKPGPGNVFNPELFCNELGVFVVWEDDRDGDLENHQIYFNKSSDGARTFLPEDQLLEFDLEGTSMSLEPKITGRGQDLMVAWSDSINGSYDIFVTTSASAGDPGTWRTAARIDNDAPPGSAFSARPQIAMSQNSQYLWVTWEDSRNEGTDIWFRHSANGGVNWEAEQRLDLGTPAGDSDSFEPQLCTDGVSNVYVVWHDSRNNVNNRDIYYNYSINGGEDFQRAALLLDEEQGTANSLYPQCIVQGTVAHVAWQDNLNESYDILYRRILDGIVEAIPPQQADVGPDGDVDSGFGNSLDLVMAASDLNPGVVAMAWNDDRTETRVDGDDGYTDLFYQYFQDGFIVTQDGQDAQDYRIDNWYEGLSYKLDLNFKVLGGQWFAVWIDGRNLNADVLFTRGDLGEGARSLPLPDGFER